MKDNHRRGGLRQDANTPMHPQAHRPRDAAVRGTSRPSLRLSTCALLVCLILPALVEFALAAAGNARPHRVLLQDNSTSEDVILFGQSAALSGPVSGLGIGMRDGISAAFKQVNAEGGINGKQLKLITYDDMYTPKLAVENTERLINEDNVFALIGQMGSPTSKQVLPIAEAAKVPFLAPYTGAEFLRRPFVKDVVNIRASYIDETAALVDYFVRVEKITRISLFYQNDAFGNAGKDGVELALDELSLPVYTYGTYERNSLEITPGLEAIYDKPNPPGAIIMIATSRALAAFVKESRRLHPEMTYFATPSPGATGQATIDLLGNTYKEAEIYVTQVVPDPTDTKVTIVQNYRKALTAFNSSLTPGFVSLEGYMAGMLAANALRGYAAITDTDVMSNEGFLDYIYDSGIIDVGDFRLGPYGGNCTQLSTGCQCNQGMREVFLTKINDLGEYEPVPDYTFQFSTCGYEPVIPDPVIMGQSVPLSGPDGLFGSSFHSGILAAFQEINVRGGIEGHQIKLVSYDDEGNAVKAANNSVRLIEEDNIFALMGPVGDASSLSVLSVAEDNAVPLIAPVSGLSSLREPFQRSVLHLRGGQNEEVAGLVHALVDKGLTDLSLIFVNESNFRLVAQTFEDVLEELGLEPLSIVSVSSSVKRSLKEISSDVFKDKGVPQGVVVLAPEAFVVDFVTMTMDNYPGIKYMATVSSITDQSIMASIPPKAFDRLIISQVVPSPMENTTNLGGKYRNALFAYDPELQPDFASLEGYIAGRFTISVMQNAQDGSLFTAGVSFDESREAFLQAVYSQEYFVIDGFPLGPFYDTPCDKYGDALKAKIKNSMFEDSEYFCPCNDGAHEVFAYSPVAASAGVEASSSSDLKNVSFVSAGDPFFYETCGFVAGEELIQATKKKEKERGTLIGVIVGVLGIVIIGSVVGVILFMRHLKKAKQDALMSTWKVNYDELLFDRLLGEGASGKTYLGKYRGADVVIKQLDKQSDSMALTNSFWKDKSSPNERSPGAVAQSSSKSNSKSNSVRGASTGGTKTSRSKKYLEHEIHMLYRLRHPNIRLFMGAHIGEQRSRSRRFSSRLSSRKKLSRTSMHSNTAEESPRSAITEKAEESPNEENILINPADHPSDSVYIVSEYMSRGTLYDVLTNPTIELDTQMQASFLRDIAKGMDFLHRQVPPVIHVDIKSKNMLLDDRWMVKVADFGHSLIFDTLGHKNRIGTPYWCAPEVLDGAPNSTASDVYSFGMVMWEVFSRKELYDGMDENTVLDGVKGGGLRPSMPSSCPSEIQDLMQKCWHQDPEARPPFSEIFSALQAWIDDNPARALPMPGTLQHHQTSQLVNKMLPAHVAKALQEGRAVEPEYFDDCTILFSDIVGYTTIASALSPKEIMSMLDRLYSAFDSLTKRHNVFKVETIGDAYMVVGNVPLPQLDHAARVGKMALDMVEVAGTIPVSLSDPSFGCINIRIGLNSGPVVASVVGDLNPRYALFGDTVNVASRMESSSHANMIQLSETTKRRVEVQDPSLQLQFRGETNIKGKGSMRTYWLRPPGHMLLLSWMNGLVNRAEVDIEDLRNLPKVYLEQAESEMELGQVLSFRKYPVYEIAAHVLTNDDSMSLNEVSQLPLGVLQSVQTEKHLYMLTKLKRDKRHELLGVIEDVVRDNTAFKLEDIMLIPPPLLHGIKDREQFEMFLGLAQSPEYDAFLTYTSHLMEKEQPPGVSIEHVLQCSVCLGTSCTSEPQTKRVLSWMIDEWPGIVLLETLLEDCSKEKDLQRKESPSSVLDTAGGAFTAEMMKNLKSKKEILEVVASIPQPVLCEVSEEEHLQKLIDLGLSPTTKVDKAFLGSNLEMEEVQELEEFEEAHEGEDAEPVRKRAPAQQTDDKESIFQSIMIAMNKHEYQLEEILEFPRIILKNCTSADDIDLVLKWRHSARFLPWVESALDGDGFELRDFLSIPHVLLNDCNSEEELCSLCSVTRALDQHQGQVESLMTSVSSDATASDEFNPKRLMSWFVEVVADGTGSVKSILAIPIGIWLRVLSRQDVVRLFEIKSSQCLPWIADIIDKNEAVLEDILVIPNRLLFSFTSKEDLGWALNLTEYNAHRLQKTEDVEGDHLSRTLTNNFIRESHRYTLDKLQNAAVQKMVLKRTQLEEELRVLEAKIDDEIQ